MKQRGEEIVLRGIPISKGIGIGLPIFFASADDHISDVPIPVKEIDLEIDRYRKALAMSRKDVESLHQLSIDEGPVEIVSILGAHLEMMQDPLLTSVIEDRIRNMQRNTESIFHHIIQEYKVRFSTLKDNYFQERVRDIVDVSKRILGHLNPKPQVKITEIPQNSIVLTHELVPSETVEANSTLVSAFVTAVGGITSHAAIIARAKGIPYVANVDFKELKNIDLETMIVDGSQGIVIINPKPSTLKNYQRLKKQSQMSYRKLKSESHLKGETIDGYEIKIFANLENPKEIDQVIKAEASGIGLFRSEYLFFSNKVLPKEDEQFLIYKKMVKQLKNKPLVIRVFDVGGDKKIELPMTSPDARYFSSLGAEPNPALGCRAIRFLIRYPEILERQLRAIIRASVFGEIHILIPMVSDISEIRFVKETVKKIQKELKAKKIPFAKEIPIGCMIEVPSTAIMSDTLSAEVDFVSIGTNDLIQYVLAADRGNTHTAELYFSTHPSILRLIRMVVSSANRLKKPVLLCGECAADPMMIPLLMGLGIREFSVAARHIPLVKHTIRKWRILEACRLAEGALEHASSKELEEYLSQEMKRD